MFYTLSMCLFLKIISHTNFLSILEKHPGFAASLSLLIHSVTISHMFLQDTPASFPLKAVSNILLISSLIFKWDLKYYPLQPNNKLIKRAWDWEFSHKQKRCFGLFRFFFFFCIWQENLWKLPFIFLKILHLEEEMCKSLTSLREAVSFFLPPEQDFSSFIYTYKAKYSGSRKNIQCKRETQNNQ